MKPFKVLNLSALMLFISWILFSGYAFAEFSQADLTGTWYGHTLTSGSEEVWEYDTVTIDSEGNVSVEYTDSNDDTGSEANVAVLTISANGIISEASDSSFHGVMSPDKNKIVFTDTWEGGNTYALTVLVRDQGSFSQSDLTGTWYAHTLTSGYWEEWEYGTVTIDSSGSVSSEITDGDSWPGSVTENDVAVVSITNDGILSVNGNPNFHGVMSPDKNIAVFTDTWDDWEGESYTLTILAKGGGSFTLADLEGTWYGHTLSTGSDWRGWEYSTMTIDGQGAVSASFNDSDGGSDSGSVTLSITENGIISVNEFFSAHGVMSLDKNMAVFIEVVDDFEYHLMILVKGMTSAPVADFSASPISGKKPLQVTFTDSSSGDISGWSWDFGDGSTSTEQNPSHTYTKPGKYTVSLTVNGTDGSDVETKTDYIHVKSSMMSWLPILFDE